MIPWKRYALIGGAVLVAFAGAWFLIGRLFPSNLPGPTKSEKTADSLAITKPIDQALIDSSNARIAHRQPASDSAGRAARIAQGRADRAGRRADSLAEIASRSADSAHAWHQAYDARKEEADSLRSIVASNATVITDLKADTTDLRFQLGVVNKRMATTEDVNKGLRKDLADARECRLLGRITCPSRIQTAALTIVTYVVIDRYRSR